MAKWIWADDKRAKGINHYADFKDNFITNKGQTTLYVSCDTAFCAYVNGKVAGFSLCADYPHYKLYDKYDISGLCDKENQLDFTVWYLGDDRTQTYITGDPGLWYVVVSDGKIVAKSDNDTLGRFNVNYQSGDYKWLTPQLAYSFHYDNTVNGGEYKKCVDATHREVIKRPQKALELKERVKSTYTYNDGYITVDLGKETAGFADLEFFSPEEQEIKVAYGESLNEGRVAEIIGNRTFSFDIKAKKGENKLFFPLRRIAGRYLEISSNKPLKIEYAGVRPVFYPVTVVDKKLPCGSRICNR